MIRTMVSALGALGALALSGCVTSGSKMDLAPFETRPATPLLEAGDYCAAEGDAAPYEIKSAEECARIAFDPTTRRYTVTITDHGKTSTLPVSIVPLKDGVILAQADALDLAKTLDETSDEPADPNRKDDDMPPYLHSAMLVVGRAMINLDWNATSDDLDALIARHPKIKVEGRGTSRTIAEGARADALDYLWDLVLVSLKQDSGGPSFMVRDRLGASDHAPGKDQQRDIEAALAKVEALRR